jgi:hypothetical protein
MLNKHSVIFLIVLIAFFSRYASAQVSDEVQEKVLDALHRKVPELSGVMERFAEHFQADTSYTNYGDTLHNIEFVEYKPGDEGVLTSKRKYYSVYVGEDHVDHTVRWYTFLVSKDLKKIRYYDGAYDKIYPLNHWKKLWPATKFLYPHKKQ